jgi:TetR/AcrR family transcriptional repressor of nem operon
MRRSREDTIETRRQIVEAASRLFRERGIAEVSVADVMGSLGLTVGGFYRHFESKEALVAEAIEAASLEMARWHEQASPHAILDSYLSDFHRTHADRGCPVAALCSEMGHEATPTRKAFTKALERLIATVDRHTSAQGQSRRKRALQTAASMVGALTLARATNDESLASELLDAVREGITSAGPRTRRPGPTSGPDRRSR